MKKKLLSLLMCSVIGISCLYGCGEVNDKVSKETNSTKENRFIKRSVARTPVTLVMG